MTPSAASHRASSRTSVGRRLTNEPRKVGIAQKVHRRSHPEASLSGAIGPVSSRVRGSPPARRPVDLPVDRRDRQQPAPVLRRVRGGPLPRHDGPQPGGDVGVVVEAEHGVRLGQRVGQLGAVPLGDAADGDDGLGRCVRPPLRSAASSSASTESFLACSTNPQVFTSTVSAVAGSSTSRNPSAANRPASSSESTSLRAHPKVTRATDNWLTSSVCPPRDGSANLRDR